jgi:hypothetical protein
MNYLDEEAEEPIKLTKEEAAAIASMNRLAKKWPKSLWLYSASGTLCVMKKDEDGEQVSIPLSSNGKVGGGVDARHVVGTIAIENDGGDW